MAKKSTKREFDWRTYSKPQRLLTTEQEAAFASGMLRPFLELALSDHAVSFEIRARQATLYYRGASIVRISGASAPFSASIDAGCASRDRSAPVPNSSRPGRWTPRSRSRRACPSSGNCAQSSTHSPRKTPPPPVRCSCASPRPIASTPRRQSCWSSTSNTSTGDDASTSSRCAGLPQLAARPRSRPPGSWSASSTPVIGPPAQPRG